MHLTIEEGRLIWRVWSPTGSPSVESSMSTIYRSGESVELVSNTSHDHRVSESRNKTCVQITIFDYLLGSSYRTRERGSQRRRPCGCVISTLLLRHTVPRGRSLIKPANIKWKLPVVYAIFVKERQSLGFIRTITHDQDIASYPIPFHSMRTKELRP